MVELRTPGEIDAMHAAGQVVAQMLAGIRECAAAGMRLRELDDVARDVLYRAGAQSPFLGYQPHRSMPPFPGVICTSVNDVALHGIPTDRRLAVGDLLSVDAGASLDGWVADAAISFLIGTAAPADAALIETTEHALGVAIAAAVPGARLGDISAAIGAVGRAAGYGIDTAHGGHGIGRTMHEAPYLPNDGRAGRGLRLRPGLVIAIEPWFMAGGENDYRMGEDGWSVCTVDGSRAAHAEHTVAVTEEDPRILTR